MICGQHRDRDLGRAGRADVDADRRMDAVDLVGASAEREQPLDALGVRLAAAERADIEAAGVERGLQREIVDLRIVGERGHRGVGCRAGGVFSTSSGHSAWSGDIGKPVRRGEGRARIDDLHVEAGDLGHRRQRLADMDRADRDQARLRDDAR